MRRAGPLPGKQSFPVLEPRSAWLLPLMLCIALFHLQWKIIEITNGRIFFLNIEIFPTLETNFNHFFRALRSTSRKQNVPVNHILLSTVNIKCWYFG